MCNFFVFLCVLKSLHTRVGKEASLCFLFIFFLQISSSLTYFNNATADVFASFLEKMHAIL
jgi:hypothetical protein